MSEGTCKREDRENRKFTLSKVNLSKKSIKVKLYFRRMDRSPENCDRKFWTLGNSGFRTFKARLGVLLKMLKASKWVKALLSVHKDVWQKW